MSKSEKEGEPSPQLEEDHYGRPRDGDRQKSRKDNDPHDTSGPILNGDERMGSSRSPPSRRYDEERGVQRPRSNTPEETGDLRERRRPSRSRSRDRRDRRQKHKSRDHRENRSRSRSHSSGRSRSRSSRRRRERDDDHENRKHSHRHGSSSSRRKVGDRRVPQFGGERDRLDGDGVPYASLGGGPGRYGGGGPPPHVGSGGMRGAGYVDDGYYGRGGGPPGPQGPYGEHYRGGPPGGYDQYGPPPPGYHAGGPPPHWGGGPRGGPPQMRGGGRGRDGGRSEAPPGVSLLVRNISNEITQEELHQAFSRIGHIRDVYIPRDYHSQQPKGFAFIEFATPEMAQDARDEMDKFVMKGRQLEVVFAQEKRKTPNEMRGRGDSDDGGGRGRNDRGDLPMRGGRDGGPRNMGHYGRGGSQDYR